MSNNRQKGVIFIGLGRKPEFYEHIVQEEFKDSKNLELRAVGRAVPRAIQIAQRFVFNKTAEYTRFISEPITIEGKENVLVIIKLKLNNQDKSKEPREKDQRNTQKRDKEFKEEGKKIEKKEDKKEDKQHEEKVQKPKKKYVEKQAEAKDKKETKEAKETKETKEADETKQTKEADETKQTKEVKQK